MFCRIPKQFALAALAVVLVSPGASAKYFSRVVIDPGHGGHDRGGRTGKVYEKHLALDTALRLERYLEASGYQVTMTRKSDTFVSLARRAVSMKLKTEISIARRNPSRVVLATIEPCSSSLPAKAME